MQQKQNLSKTEQSVKIYLKAYFCNSKNSEKLGQRGKFIYQYFVKISDVSDAPVQKQNSSTGRKTFCFPNNINYTIFQIILKALLGTNTN